MSLQGRKLDMRVRGRFIIAFGTFHMSFGRQNNLVRRAFRPDSRATRDLRRKSVSKASILDAGMNRRASLLSRVIKSCAKLFGR